MKRNFSIVLVVAMIQLVCVSTSFAAPIHDAARDGNLARVQELIAADPTNRESEDNVRGGTALLWAARYGHIEIVQALIDAGADVDGNAGAGSATPLHNADQAAIVQVLIAAGANINATNRHDQTPLEYAQLHGKAAAVIAAFQPQAIAQLHTQTAESHTTAGNHALAARSHNWAAQALPGTDAARVSYTKAAESHTAAGDHRAAAESYVLAGNHARAAESHSQYADNQVAAGNYAPAVEHYRLSQAAHTALGNHEAAGLSQAMVNFYSPIVDGQRHSQAMEIHFTLALAKVREIQAHRTLGDEVAANLAEAQLQESLESADSSAEKAVVAFQAALTALEGALVGATDAHEEAQVANAPAESLAQHAAQVASLQAHMRSVSSKMDETHVSAAAGHASVSAARGN